MEKKPNPNGVVGFHNLPLLFHKKFLDEIFGHWAGSCEMAIMEIIVHGYDVLQCLFISVSLERRCTTQAKGKQSYRHWVNVSIPTTH